MRIATLILAGGLLCAWFLATAQQQPNSRTDLENRRKSIMESIRQTQQQLEITKQDKNATIGQLRALQNKLQERQKLIGTINQEISQINNSIQLSAHEISQLRNNLNIQKVRYAQSVRYAYKNRSSYDMLAFLFSSQDFNEALRRMRYLRRYRDVRKEQANEIRNTQGQIVRKINLLNSERSQKDVLLNAELVQRQTLEQETDQTNQVVRSLKGRESQLLADIEKNRKSVKQLERTINDIIRREIEIARKKAEEEERKRLAAEQQRKQEEERKRLAAANASTGGMTVNTGSGVRPVGGTAPTAGNTRRNIGPSPAPPTAPAPTASTPPPATTRRPAPSYTLSLTPEVTALSNSFETNRGRLPWPVEKGFIAEGFGRHQHIVASKVTVDNIGIDIRTNPGAAARAVFDGTVTKVFYLPGLGQSVMISHGQYFTVYTKLATVSVKAGDKIRAKQNIGTVMTDEENETLLNFQVWKVGSNNSISKMDPAGWIAQ